MSYRNSPPSSFPPQGGSSLTSDRQPVLVAAAGPGKQSRATVAFRIVLVIPHFVVLYILGVVASVVAFIGWFGALFTGRLPDFAAVYLSGYVRWYCRVAAYLLLLTDKYPPFLFEDSPYPVRMAVRAGRLNRAAVLFRLILAIPAAILSTIMLSGLSSIVIFIAWLVALFAGKLPRSLHQAFAAVLRYSTRYYGYLYLLTDTYPKGLFGDKPGGRTEDYPGGPGYGGPDPAYGRRAAGYDAPPGYRAPGYGYGPPPGYGGPDPAYGRQAAGYEAPPGYGAPGYGPPPGYGAPGYGYGPPPGYGGPDPAYGRQAAGYEAPYGAPGYGAPGQMTAGPGYGEQPPGYPTARVPRHRAATAQDLSQPAGWQMVLSAGAKQLLGLILVLGLVTTVGGGVAAGSAISSVLHRGNQINQLNAAIAENNNAIHQNQQAVAQLNNALFRITSAHAKLGSQMGLVVSASKACGTVACFDTEAVHAAGVVAAFGRKLKGVAIPHASAQAERKFLSDVARYKQAWAGMGHSTSFTDYANRAGRAEKAGARFDRDYRALTASLNTLSATLNRQTAQLNQRAKSLNRQAAALNAGS